jgi:hypothetical protein
MAFLRRQAKSMLGSLVFNATGGKNIILFLARQHQIDGIPIHGQRGTVSLAQMLSLLLRIIGK